MAKDKYIGIMSGTSLDGVDVALCEIDAQGCTLISAVTHPMPKGLKEAILKSINEATTLQAIGELDHRLGLLFAEAVEALLKEVAIDRSEITAIGLHGQTLWHAPHGKHPFSIQLGDPNLVAAHTGIATVADFRRKDMAYGGQGAPLAPAFHRFIFKNINTPAAVVNIGGIANITILADKTVGYDTGPGNLLMDAWIAKHQGVAYDKDGAWAREGRVIVPLLEVMLSDSYFKKAVPKSTGREYFNTAWLASKLQEVDSGAFSDTDVQRTLLELTAVTIAEAIKRAGSLHARLCGGGAYNRLLVERISALCDGVSVEVAPHADMIEAMMMAWLAYKRVHREPVALAEVTGTTRDTILGGIYEP